MRGVATVAVAALIAGSAPANAQAERLETYTDWSAHVSEEGDNRVCFVVSQPKDTEPKNVKRGPIYFYVSTYPAENVTNEISVKMGYPLKPGVNAEVKIGDAGFTLFTKDEGAYVAERDEEARLVEAMKGGLEMVVQGRSTRGTLTTDTYSLRGVTDALNRISQECG